MSASTPSSRVSRGPRPAGSGSGADDSRAARNRRAVEEELERGRAEYNARQSAITAERRRDAGLDYTNTTNMSPEQQQLARAQNLQEENLASLQNSIRKIEETNQTADQTMEQLVKQREQMMKMDENLNATNESVTRSERILRGMKSWGGTITNWFTKPKAHKAETFDMYSASTSVTDPSNKAAEPSSSPSSSSSSSSDNGLNKNKRGVGSKDELMDREQQRRVGLREAANRTSNTDTAKSISALADNQDKEDEALDALSAALQQLQTKAVDMNKELQVHDKLIDHIDNQVSKTTTHINKQNKTISKIL